jgi:murein tripeptide amidase MpaA/SAM-dependent methyltransferase
MSSHEDKLRMAPLPLLFHSLAYALAGAGAASSRAPLRHPTTVTAAPASSVSVSSSFDSGNGRLVFAEGDLVTVRIEPDPATELEECRHLQWFAFRSTLATVAVGRTPSANDERLILYEIDNAGLCSYASAWDGAEVCVSHDRRSWRRVPTTRYDASEGRLRWEWRHTPSQPTAYFAYFDVYTYERHLDFVARCAAAAGAPGLRVSSLGQSLEGRDLDYITVGTGPLHAWVVHRQHPGEPQASFFAEGLLSRLLGLNSAGRVDELADRMLAAFTWHIVPLMNPDGACRGHLRTNAAGANLNREWAPTGEYDAPTLARSPEVFHVLRAMDATGVDFFLDVHGDEGLPFGFLAGNEGNPNWEGRLRALHGAFVAAYARATGDMQARFGYKPDPPGGSNPAVGADQVGRRFGCLAAILELPFKDNAANPSARRGDQGFDGPRCAAVGASLLEALAYVQPSLRGVAEPSFSLAGDAYLEPVEDEEEVQRFITAGARARAAAGARVGSAVRMCASDGLGSAGEGGPGSTTEGKGGAMLWQSAEDRERWYERGKLYWEWAAPTNDGVMSGIGPLHDADIADSRRFLGQPAIWPGLEFRRAGRALDIGAGIGRVSGGLLLDLCGTVDLVDGSAGHLDQARASLGAELPPAAPRGRVGRFIREELQSFVPDDASYDLIWIQWTTMYLTDDDLRRLLADCKRALAPGGVLVLKDNVIDEVRGAKGLVDGRYMVDEEDASVSRTRDHLLRLVGQAGLSVVAATDANLESEELSTCLSVNGWTEMHPVVMLAMR